MVGGLDGECYTVNYKPASTSDADDDINYQWTVYGLTPYTKYRFRVAIFLTGSNFTLTKQLVEFDDTHDISLNRIVTQPSLVVRTSQSNTLPSSKPIIISVQQVGYF